MRGMDTLYEAGGRALVFMSKGMNDRRTRPTLEGLVLSHANMMIACQPHCPRVVFEEWAHYQDRCFDAAVAAGWM